MLRYQELHGYKYRVWTEESVCINMRFDEPIIGNRYFKLYVGNDAHPGQTLLSVKEDYMWDGPSGPTIDDRTNMRASLVHDVLYQAMREGLIDRSYRKAADQELRRLMIKDGLAWLKKPINPKDKKNPKKNRDTALNRAWVRARAQGYYLAVRTFGAKTSLPGYDTRGKIVEIP